MKTVKVNSLMGSIQIPEHYNIVSNGLTQTKDQVATDSTFRLFSAVKVGGVPVSRYYAVIRPESGVKVHKWSKTRKFESAKPKTKAKKTVKRAMKKKK